MIGFCKIWRLIKNNIGLTIWVLMLLFSLYIIFFSQGFLSPLSADQGIMFLVMISLINFPIGFIIWIILGTVIDMLSPYMQAHHNNYGLLSVIYNNLNNWWINLIIFICISVLGYLQWFKLLSYILKKYYSKP
jgi:hypothetical protein